MSTPFLSSEEYDERAHALYNEGEYDQALTLLREGLALYPNAVDLHVGVAYARLAQEEYAWARRAFDEALVLDPEHEDALAGLGETLLKLGQTEQAIRVLDRTIALGYDDDVDLMLQIGRALFREGFLDNALGFFERAVSHAPDSAEAVACRGYAQHRLGNDAEAMVDLERALAIDTEFAEARVYLANLLYDAGDAPASLAAFEATQPGDHWDELGIWRLIELKKAAKGVADGDAELQPWEARLEELSGDGDAIDALLAEVEQTVTEREESEAAAAQEQLETLGTLLSDLAERQAATVADDAIRTHAVLLSDGRSFEGTWDQIVAAIRDVRDAGRSVQDYMAAEARRHYGATGTRIATHASEAFIRGSADAGLLRILR